MKHVFISDCEGPISKNDNAFEVTANFVPHGDKIFPLTSIYDDVLTDLVKKKGYSAGGTLKLILPFLKAYGVTDALMSGFSAKTLILIAGSQDTLSYIVARARAFIVSTSYEHYIRVLCRHLNFPYENTYCTKLSIDKYSLSPRERIELKKMASEIARMPMITVPSSASYLEDLSSTDQETVNRLDDIFWNRISGMSIGKILSEIEPIGGKQKADAVMDAVGKLGVHMSNVMYVGDSITDVEAFKLVRARGGLTVSFNGNQHAVRNAEIAVLSENSIATAIIADLFYKLGKFKTLQTMENWDRNLLAESVLDPHLLDRLFKLYPMGLPKVQIVTAKNMNIIVGKSNEFRKRIRGEAIGRLG